MLFGKKVLIFSKQKSISTIAFFVILVYAVLCPGEKIPLLFSVPAYISEIPFPWTKRLLWNRHTVVLLSAYNLSDIAGSFQCHPDQNSYPRSHPVLPDTFCQLSVIFTGLISGHILKELQSCFFMIRILFSTYCQVAILVTFSSNSGNGAIWILSFPYTPAF